MAIVPDGGPDGITPTDNKVNDDSVKEKTAHETMDEKHPDDIEVVSNDSPDSDYDEAAKIYVPEDTEEFIDPRLKDYPVPLVAKTVDLHNNFR